MNKRSRNSKGGGGGFARRRRDCARPRAGHRTQKGKVLSAIFYRIDIFKGAGNPGGGGGCVTETGAQRGRGSVLAKDPPWRLRVEVTSLFGEFWAEMRLCIALGNFQGYSSLFLS